MTELEALRKHIATVVQEIVDTHYACDEKLLAAQAVCSDWVDRYRRAMAERDKVQCDLAHAQFDRDAALNLVESAEARAKQSEMQFLPALRQKVEAMKRAEVAEARARNAESKCYPYMCRIGHSQIGHSTDGESCPVCVEKGKTRFAAAEAAGLRKALGMMRDELMRLHEIICEEDAQSIETLLKETDALMNVPAPSTAILAVVEAARAVADDYIIPSSLILSLRKALRAIDGGK